MVARSGIATRPAEALSDYRAGYWPPPGTKVAWVLAPILIRLAESAESLGWTVYSIGDKENHLVKHGDHTPWSDPGAPGAPKKRGVVYAIDVMVPSVTVPAFTKWLISYCKSNVDTSWIDFFNIGGSQYNFAGSRLGSSTDQHLHLSVQLGKENAISALFSAWRLFVDPPPPPPIRKGIPDMKLIKITGDKTGAIYRTDGWFYEHLTPAAYNVLKLIFGDPIDVPSLDGLRPFKEQA
jgi:hypothetical protein